jgi:hypothetical protein
MIIRHKVADFDKWKPEFDDHRPFREASGLRDLYLWRNADDPKEIILLVEASDIEKAREFAASSDLEDKMQSAGVQGVPDILFLSDV